MNNEEKDKKGITRRTFIAGSAFSAAGIAAASFLPGCSPKENNQPGTTGEAAKASFETPPAPIPDSEIKQTVEADVVVVGAGMSGLCASISAAEAGAKVILLEKSATVNFRGYDYGAIDAKTQKSIGNKVDRLKAVQEVMQFGAYKGDQKVVSLWANNSGMVADWIMGMGEALGCSPEAVPIDQTTTPGALFEPLGTLSFRLKPNDAALAASPKGTMPYTAATAYVLSTSAKNAGVDIRFKTPAVQLIRQEKGRVTGVIAGEKGNYSKYIAKKGVILCTGDYGSDPEMLKKYIPSSDTIQNNLYEMFSGKINTGDGHKMGLWVGAAMDEGPHAPMYFDFAVVGAPIFADALMRQPWLNVNLRGERYSNEELPYSYICNAQRQLPGHTKWSVWDAKGEEEARRFNEIACKDLRTPFHNPDNVKQYIEKGYIKSANTIDELAQKMNVPVDTFKATVARYNELAKKGVDEDFGKRAECLTTIEKAPFYAANLGTSLLVTLGGLQINDKLQVLDTEKNIIPGLYAAGNVSGSYYANDYPNILPGNSHGRAFTFGYLAGKNIVSLG